MKSKKNQTSMESKHFADILYIFHKNHKDYLNFEFAKYDLSLIQIMCIFKVYQNEGVNQKDLATDLSLTKGAITKRLQNWNQMDISHVKNCLKTNAITL